MLLCIINVLSFMGGSHCDDLSLQLFLYIAFFIPISVSLSRLSDQGGIVAVLGGGVIDQTDFANVPL